MKRLAMVAISFLVLAGCKQKAAEAPVAQKVVSIAELADAVPQTGPREGNHYKLFLKMQQTNSPAVGFKVDAWVKGKSEPVTLVTDENGIVIFENLPFPETNHQVNATFHYYRGKRDQSREIAYPFVEGDAYRMKDTQYIPNDATPEPTK